MNKADIAGWFSGKTALVTGATSGIGREIARHLACYGVRVLCCGRDGKAMNLLLEELNADSSLPAEGFSADLADEKPLKEFIEKIHKNYEVDILVNNAGFGNMNVFYQMDEAEIDSMQAVNMSAVVALCRAFLPAMKDKAGSGILNVGSIASFFPTPGSALYGATKHFVLGLTDALHQEMLPFDVHITGVYPGKTKSRFLERATGGSIKDWDQATSPGLVAESALRGLSENRVRVIPGLGNRAKVFIASIMPISLLLKKTSGNKVKVR